MYLQGFPPSDIASVIISLSTATDCVRPAYKQLRATSSNTFYKTSQEKPPFKKPGTKLNLSDFKKYLLLHKMAYIISINLNFARTLDEQATLRSAELSGTFTTFKYNLQGLFVVDHPFDWLTFDLPLTGRLLDWAIYDVCEFVRSLWFFF